MFGFIFAVASAVFSHKRQKSAQKKAAREADKRKGFLLPVEGEPIYLPLVYGYQKVGGVKTLHKTYNNGALAPRHVDFKRFFKAGKGITSEQQQDIDMSGLSGLKKIIASLHRLGNGKNTILLIQQALCFGGISEVLDLEVDGINWDDVDQKFAHMLEVNLDGGIPNPTATNLGAPSTNKFTNTAYLTGVFVLDRDDPQYSGIPDVAAYVKGSKVRDLNQTGNTVSFASGSSFSNNPALVLLDYLTRPVELGGCGYKDSDIDLASFYRAKNICDIVVAENVTVKGRVNGVRPVKEGQSPNARTRDIKLYEANITIDTEQPRRTNIERILETMNQAELIWSEGQYKLVLEYPGSKAGQDALISGSYSDADIINDQVSVTWTGAEDRFNRATVEFLNEEENFTTDSVSWPVRGSVAHTTYLTQDRGIPNEGKQFLHGATHRKQALAKAEELVRASRIGKEVNLTLDRSAIVHEVGDLIEITSAIGELDSEVFRIEEMEINENLTVSIKGIAFSWDTLAFNVDDDYIAPDKFYIESSIQNVTNLTFNSGTRTGNLSAGWLSWDDPEEQYVTNYRVYARQINEEFDLIGNTGNNYFDIPPEYNDGEDRYFMVVVEALNGRLSSGAIVLVDLMPRIVPVTNLVANPDINTINLKWNDSVSNLVQRYEVFRSPTSNRANAILSGSTTEPNYVYSPAELEDHYFWIESVGLKGERASSGSAFVSQLSLGISWDKLNPDITGVIVTYPALPTGLMLTSYIDNEGMAVLGASWTPATDASYYEMELTEDNKPAFIHQSASTEFEFKPLISGSTVSVRLRSVSNTGHKSNWSEPEEIEIARDTVPPAVPTGLVAEATFNSAWIKWNRNSEYDLSHYQVQIQGGSSYISQSNVFFIDGLNNGQNYNVRVRAYDTSGNASGWTSFASFTPVSVSDRIQDEINNATWATELGFITPWTGPALPTTNIGPTISWNNKLYKWDINKYSALISDLPDEAYVFRVGSGDTGLELVKGNELSGAASQLRVRADNIILEGTVQTPQLAAGAVTASKAAFGDTSNKVPDDEYRDLDGSWTLNTGAATYGVAGGQSTSGYGQERVMTIRNLVAGADNWSRLVASNHIPVQGNKEYYASLSLWAQTAGSTVLIRIGWYDRAGAYISTLSLLSGTLPAGNRTLTASGAAPAGATTARAEFFLNRSGVLTNYNLGKFLLREKNAAVLIQDGSLTAPMFIQTESLFTNDAQIHDGFIKNAHINDLSAAKLTAGTALAGSITVAGTALSTVRTNAALGAQNPVNRINSGTTNIDPGRILISGSTTLSAWRGLQDTTAINGGAIETESIFARSLKLGDTSNLIVNGDMTDAVNPVDTYFSFQGNTNAIWQGNAQNSGTHSLQIQRNVSTETRFMANPAYFIPVSAGEEFSCQLWQWVNATSQRGLYFRVRWHDASKTFISHSDAIANGSSGVGWHLREGSVTAPANAAFAQVQVWQNNGNSTTTIWRIDRIIFRRKTGTINIGDGVITGPKLDMESVLGRIGDFDQAFIRDAHITELNANKISLSGENNGFSAGKLNLADPAYGLYFGRSNGKFGFSMSQKDSDNLTQSVEMTEDKGVHLTNPKFTISQPSENDAIDFLTSSQTIYLPSGAKSISFVAVGGGAGGSCRNRTVNGKPGQNGQASIIRLLDGDTLIQEWVAEGWVGRNQYELFRGGHSYFDTGTSRNNSISNFPCPDALYGAGGGVGGYVSKSWTDSSNTIWDYRSDPTITINPYTGEPGFIEAHYNSTRGGNAGQALEVSNYDVSSLINPRLEFVSGSGGAGAIPDPGFELITGVGGKGGDGAIRVLTKTTREYPANVIPLMPTAEGSIVKPNNATGYGIFPDLGPGMWCIFTASGDLNLGTLTITSYGQIVHIMQTQYASFIAQTDIGILDATGAKTFYYRFYRMAGWYR